MVSALVILTVAGTAYSRVEDKAQEVAIHYRLDVTHTASYNFNTTRLQFVQCAGSHTSCQHHLDPHMLQIGGNA